MYCGLRVHDNNADDIRFCVEVVNLKLAFPSHSRDCDDG